MIQAQLKLIKASVFQSFYQLKCYSLTSRMLLYIIFIARILSQLTAINQNIIASDPAFKYLKFIKNQLTIGPAFMESNKILIVIVIFFFMQLLYLYCIFTMGYNQNGNLKTIKLMIIKLTGFLIFVLRINIINIILTTILIEKQKNSYFFLALLFLVLGFMIIITIANEIFCTQVTLKHSSKTLLSKNYHFINVISQAILIFGIILGNFSFENNQHIFLVGCNCILILAFSLKLWILIMRKKYYFQQTQNIQIFECNLCILFYLLIILSQLIDILQQNMFLTLLVMSIFNQFAILNYKKSRNQMSIYYLNPFQNDNSQCALPQISIHQGQNLIYQISQLIKQYKRQKEYILIISLITEHLRICKNNKCYHHEYEHLNKRQMIQNVTFRIKFLFGFIENIYFYYSSHFQIWAHYHVFKLEITQNFPQIQFQLQKYRQTHQKTISLSDQFALYQIHAILQKFIKEKNSLIRLVHVQKVIQQEQKGKEIIDCIKQILIESNQRFQALEETIVNLNKVESIITGITKNIRKIQTMQIQCFKKYQYNIFTQEVFLFYYNFVVHSVSQSNQIFKIIKSKLQYLKSLKGNTIANNQKFMYQEKSCVIQSVINPQKIGLISNITQNCLTIFGFKKKELIHDNINKIIPKFLNQEHDKLVQNFFKTGCFSRFGQKIQTYSTTKKGCCFKVLVDIQIRASYNALKVYILIMKTNDVPNIMMDQKFFLKGYDQRLTKIFDSTDMNEYFINFCLNFPKFQNNLTLKEPQNLQLLIVDSFYKEMVLQLQQLNLNLKNYLQKIKHYLKSGFRTSKSSIILYICQVQIQRIKFGKKQYFNMKFKGISQTFISSQKIQIKEIIQNGLNALSRTKKKTSLLKRLQTIKKIQSQELVSFLNLTQLSKSDENLQKKPEEQVQQFSQKKFKQQNRQITQSTSSKMANQECYYIQKLLKVIKQKFLNPRKFSFRELDIATCVIFILVLAIIALLIVEFVIFDRNLSDFQSVSVANQKASYTLQLLELIYNKAMLMYQYCLILPTFSDRCQQAITSSKYMQDYLFEQLSAQFEDLMTLKTSNNFLDYQYLIQPIKFVSGNKSHQIQTLAFIQTCIYAIHSIRNQFESNSTNNSLTHKMQMFQTLKDNWNSIKFLNRNNSILFTSKGSQLLDDLKFQLQIFSGFIMLLAVLIVFTQRKLNSYLENKRQKIIRLNQNIPEDYLKQNKVYCCKILDKINKGCFWRQDQDLQLPVFQQNVYYRHHEEFIYKKSKIQYYFLSLFLILMGCTVFFSFYQMTQALTPFKHVQSKLNQFINSQRLVLQNYFDLKQMFLFDNFNSSNLTAFNKLYNQMFQIQVKYNKISLQVFNLFPDSQTYKDDIKHYLTENICELAIPYLSKWQNEQCTKSYLSFYKYGVLPLMDYNQRISVIVALSLKKSPKTAPYVYSNIIFYDIDRNPIYIMQIFKLIQDRINIQIQNYKQQKQTDCLWASSFMLIMLLVIISFLLLNYKKTIKMHSNFYGQIIVFPLGVLLKSKTVQKVIKQNLSLENSP